jgi:YbbR domain-containing protein
MELLNRVARNLPTLIFAFAMALAVWITSVTQADPTSRGPYSRPVTIETIGQDPGTVLTEITPPQVSMTINAPQSIWRRLNTEDGLVSAVVDLSGLGPGTHTVRVQTQMDVRPAEYTIVPQSATVTLEKLATESFPVRLTIRGEPSIGFQAGDAELSTDTITVSGPESLVSQVQDVRAALDLAQSHENIERSLSLEPLDRGETPVEGVTLTPDKVNVKLPIAQRFGFRTVSVKVVVTGQIASGYRVTNISVFPPAVTVSSANPQIVNTLPGYIETAPVNVDGLKNAIDVRVALNPPEGVKVEGDQTVLVQVGIAAIESNLTLRNMPVETVGLPPNLAAHFAPESVDIILTGPLPVLESLNASDVHVIVDLTDLIPGTYQVIPTVVIDKTNELRVVSVQPGSLEAVVIPAPTPTPTPKP